VCVCGWMCGCLGWCVGVCARERVLTCVCGRHACVKSPMERVNMLVYMRIGALICVHSIDIRVYMKLTTPIH